MISHTVCGTKSSRGVPYIAASCPLQSAAGSEKWDTMMAASLGSRPTYTDKELCFYHVYEFWLNELRRGHGVTVVWAVAYRFSEPDK